MKFTFFIFDRDKLHNVLFQNKYLVKTRVKNTSINKKKKTNSFVYRDKYLHNIFQKKKKTRDKHQHQHQQQQNQEPGLWHLAWQEIFT